MSIVINIVKDSVLRAVTVKATVLRTVSVIDRVLTVSYTHLTLPTTPYV